MSLSRSSDDKTPTFAVSTRLMSDCHSLVACAANFLGCLSTFTVKKIRCLDSPMYSQHYLGVRWPENFQLHTNEYNQLICRNIVKVFRFTQSKIYLAMTFTLGPPTSLDVKITLTFSSRMKLNHCMRTNYLLYDYTQ